MRHLARLVVLALAICSSSTVFAADHNMRIGEVLLSKGNDTAIQYLELEDPVQESFPNNPYAVVIYNAAGTQQGQPVQFTVPMNTQRFLVGTAAADTAYGTTRDATLPASLPADGQACFMIAGANVKIMCLAWGCIQVQIVAPVMLRAPSPPTDQSVQRQSTGEYQLATPTPDAANVAGTSAVNCATDPPPPVTDGPPLLDSGLTPDSGVAIDAGTGGNNNGDDGGGCCRVDGSRGAAGSCLLALGVLLAIRRRQSR